MTPTALSWALGHIKQGQANHSGKMFSVECSTHARVSSTPQIPFQSAALLLLLLAQLIPICRIKLGAPPKETCLLDWRTNLNIRVNEFGVL